MKSGGQALVEYILILVVIALIAVKFLNSLSKAMGEGMGALATNLSNELTTGVCSRECFSDAFKNGHK